MLEHVGEDIAAITDSKSLGAYLKYWHGLQNSNAAFFNGQGETLLERNAALVDTVLLRIYDLSVQRAGLEFPHAAGTVPAIAIVATGGYGRGELAPYSDVDVTFIPAHEDDSYLNAIIKDMFQSVMDVFLYGANLKVGYAYRYIGDLAELDHQTQTALLDSRFLCGDETIYREFLSTFRSRLLTAHFMFNKWAERETVLQKFGGDTVYGVEPNIKEGSGGLRDIQNAEWIGEARFRASLNRIWTVLCEREFIQEDDVELILQARQFLWMTRCAVHIVSGSARDALTTEKQEPVAVMLGYTDSADTPAVEKFMRDYYQHVAASRRISRQVITRCLDSEISMGLGLASVNRCLVVTDCEAAWKDAALPLHVAELLHAYGLRSTPALEEKINNFIEANPAPLDPSLSGMVFTRLLAATGVSTMLGWLEERGAISWLIPDFGPLMYLIPYDAAHDFTVGAHSLRVVAFLDALRTETEPKYSDYKKALAEVAHVEVLLLAAMIHDIGKQWPDQAGHAEVGAKAAESISLGLGWDRDRIDKLMFLVRHHLLMAETSRLRDLTLDETVQQFVSIVSDTDTLNMLYLLTYADTNAVGSGIWTEVKSKFLTELYYRSEAALAEKSDDATTPAFVPNLARQRERIRRQLALRNLPQDIIHEHTRNLPAQYLLNTPLEDMYLHIAMVGRLRETYQPIVDFRHEFGSEYTELTLVAFDDPKPGLLAKITGVLYAHDVNVHVAQVFTREASVPIAIDTVWVDFRGRPLSGAKKAEVQESLQRVLLGELGLDDLLAKHKKVPKEQTIYAAKIDDASSDRFSVLEVTAPDEKGTLFRLARLISSLGWDIHAARLSVWGSRARDAFYITDAQGTKIQAEDVARLTDILPMTAFTKRTLTQVGRGQSQ